MVKTTKTLPDSYGSMKMATIVACTLFYFLIFAQFAYLHSLEAVDPHSQLQNFSLCCMGLGGIIGCLLVGKKHRLHSSLAWLLSGFGGCAVCALLISTQPEKELYPLFGFGIGLFLSILAVSVVAILQIQLPKERIGLWTGASVGTAYFFCNMPIIFQRTAMAQCLYAFSACIVGSAISISMKKDIFAESLKPTKKDNSPQTIPYKKDRIQDRHPREKVHFYTSRSLWMVIFFLLILVWYDSASFYVIQAKISEKGVGFENGLLQWKNGVIHLLSALIAGWALDQRWIFILLSVYLFGLFVGIWGVQNSQGYFWIALYIASVSSYSTVLVAFVALELKENEMVPARIQAALIYAIGGWFGSVMGILMVHDPHNISWMFAAAALVICIGGKTMATIPRRSKAEIKQSINK